MRVLVLGVNGSLDESGRHDALPLINHLRGGSLASRHGLPAFLS